ELDPTKEDAYLLLTVSAVKLFEYEEAVKTLKELIKVNPDSALGYFYLGKTYDQMKLNREAIGYYKKAVELKPDFEQGIIDLGIAQENLGMYNDAIVTFRGLLENNQF